MRLVVWIKSTNGSGRAEGSVDFIHPTGPRVRRIGAREPVPARDWVRFFGGSSPRPITIGANSSYKRGTAGSGGVILVVGADLDVEGRRAPAFFFERGHAVATRGVIGFVLAVVGAGPALGQAAGPTVVLEGWAGPGVMVRGQGMSGDLIQLVAECRWDRSAARDPARYSIRATLPGGQVETRPYPVDSPPGNRRFLVYVPAGPLRDLTPSAVKVGVEVVDAATGAALSNSLEAVISDLPRPRGDASAVDPGPFGRGKPLDDGDRSLPGPGPDGFRFVRVPGPAGFFAATTEATVKQVADRLAGYDPKAGRSDEFTLEDPAQPAIGLTPARAEEYLRSLAQADAAGISYRLPTAAEWVAAAKGGKASAFWWGDEPTHPEGANFLGPEPALAGDATAPSTPVEAAPTFAANPFGLFHTYGNAAEWATDPASGEFVRMGGHFRTEPASPLPAVAAAKADEVGPDPFVGVRPVFDLSPEAGADLVKKRLAAGPGPAGVRVAYDPDRAAVTLSGPVADSSARRAADRLLEGLWFVASVDNRLETPAIAPGQLATLGDAAGPARRTASLGRTFLEVPIAARWFDPLPVSGSNWWVNVYLPGGGHVAHKLVEVEPGRSTRLMVTIDREQLAAAGLTDGSPFSVALSLGGPASTPTDPRVVSNLTPVRPVVARGKSR